MSLLLNKMPLLEWIKNSNRPDWFFTVKRTKAKRKKVQRVRVVVLRVLKGEV